MARRTACLAFTLFLIALAAGADLPQAYAGAFAYGARDRVFKVANLLIWSARHTSQPPYNYYGPTNLENPDPHIWYIANLSPYKPYGWDLDNPLAPEQITQEIYDRWVTRYGGVVPADIATDPRFQVGQPVGRNMGSYFEVVLNEADLDDLLKYDLLFIHNHRVTAFTKRDYDLLRKLVDAGAAVWLEDCAGLHIARAGEDGREIIVNDAVDATGFIAAVQFFGGPAGIPGISRSYFADRYQALVSFPNWLSQFEADNLGDKWNGDMWRMDYYDTSVWREVTLNNAGLPYVMAGRYGSGYLVAGSGDTGCKINDTVREPNSPNPRLNRTGSGNNSEVFCGTDFTIPFNEDRWRGDFKYLMNASSWASTEWTTFRRNARHTARGGEQIGGALKESWNYGGYRAVPPMAGGEPPFLPSAVSADSIVITVTPDGQAVALDTIADRDLDRDGNPDDGLPEANPLSRYDQLWTFDLGTRVLATPVITYVPLVNDLTVPGADAVTRDVAVFAGVNGWVTALRALPRSPLPAYTVQPVTAPYAPPRLMGGPIYASPAAARGWVYVATDNGQVSVIELSPSSPANIFTVLGTFSANASFVASPTVGLTEDSLTGAMDETVYVGDRTANGDLYAIVFRTYGEELAQVAADIFQSRRQGFYHWPKTTALAQIDPSTTTDNWIHVYINRADPGTGLRTLTELSDVDWAVVPPPAAPAAQGRPLTIQLLPTANFSEPNGDEVLVDYVLVDDTNGDGQIGGSPTGAGADEGGVLKWAVPQAGAVPVPWPYDAGNQRSIVASSTLNIYDVVNFGTIGGPAIGGRLYSIKDHGYYPAPFNFGAFDLPGTWTASGLTFDTDRFMGLVLRGVAVTPVDAGSVITVTGVNQDGVAGRTWIASLSTDVNPGFLFPFYPTVPGDLCTQVTDVASAGGTTGSFQLYGYVPVTTKQPERLWMVDGGWPVLGAGQAWDTVASPAETVGTAIFGLASEMGTVNDRGQLLGLEINPALTLRLSHPRLMRPTDGTGWPTDAGTTPDFVVVDAVSGSRLLPRYQRWAGPDGTWGSADDTDVGPGPDREYRTSDDPFVFNAQGYRVDFAAGTIKFNPRDAGKRVAIAYRYQIGVDANGLPVYTPATVSEYYTLPRLHKWAYPAMAVPAALATPDPLSVSMQDVTITPAANPDGSADANDQLFSPLWADDLNGRVYVSPDRWGHSVNVVGGGAGGGAVAYTPQTKPVLSVIASPVVSNETAYAEATDVTSLTRRMVALSVDPVDGTRVAAGPFGARWVQYGYDDHGMADPDNLGNRCGVYDLIADSRVLGYPNGGWSGSPAVAASKFFLTGYELQPPGSPDTYQWTLRAMGNPKTVFTDPHRVVKTSEDAAGVWGMNSTSLRDPNSPPFTPPGEVTQYYVNRPLDHPATAKDLSQFGRSGNLLVADMGNDRVVEVDLGGLISMQIANLTDDGIYGVGAGYLAFSDPFGWLPLGRTSSTGVRVPQVPTLSAPNDAERLEYQQGSALVQQTVIADTGNYRLIVVENQRDFNTGTPLDENGNSLPRDKFWLMWASAPNMLVAGLTALEEAAGAGPAPGPVYTGPEGSFVIAAKEAAKYRYLSAEPAFLRRPEPGGIVVLSAVNNYALDSQVQGGGFPPPTLPRPDATVIPPALSNDPTQLVIERGAGSSLALLDQTGRVFAGFSRFYQFAGARGIDQPILEVRCFHNVHSAQARVMIDEFPVGVPRARFYVTVTDDDGVYPLLIIVRFRLDNGTWVPDQVTRPVLCLPPANPVIGDDEAAGSNQAWGPSAVLAFERQTYVDVLLAMLTRMANPATQYPRYPLGYTGPSDSLYAYFRPTYASLQPDGVTLLIANGHERRSEVLEINVAGIQDTNLNGVADWIDSGGAAVLPEFVPWILPSPVSYDPTRLFQESTSVFGSSSPDTDGDGIPNYTDINGDGQPDIWWVAASVSGVPTLVGANFEGGVDVAGGGDPQGFVGDGTFEDTYRLNQPIFVERTF